MLEPHRRSYSTDEAAYCDRCQKNTPQNRYEQEITALSVYVEAIAAGNCRAKNLYFDVATLTNDDSAETLRQTATLTKKIGLKRILYGTNTALADEAPCRLG